MEARLTQNVQWETETKVKERLKRTETFWHFSGPVHWGYSRMEETLYTPSPPGLKLPFSSLPQYFAPPPLLSIHFLITPPSPAVDLHPPPPNSTQLFSFWVIFIPAMFIHDLWGRDKKPSAELAPEGCEVSKSARTRTHSMHVRKHIKKCLLCIRTWTHEHACKMHVCTHVWLGPHTPNLPPTQPGFGFFMHIQTVVTVKQKIIFYRHVAWPSSVSSAHHDVMTHTHTHHKGGSVSFPKPLPTQSCVCMLPSWCVCVHDCVK